MSQSLKDGAQAIARWRADPVSFVRECLKVEQIDSWEEKALHAFPTNQRLAIKGAKGLGKSAVLAWCVWNFIVTRPHPRIVVTSITGDNLTDGLWSELAKWQRQSEFLKHAFEWTKTRIIARNHEETWWASARAWSKTASSQEQADALAGPHADYFLFVLDEVGGIPDAVMATAEAGLATGKETKLLIAGNPTHVDGPLYRACTTERHLWWLIELTGDPDDAGRCSRMRVEWAREQIEKYGRDNPWVAVNVFGRFPPSNINSLIGPDEVADSMKRALRSSDHEFSQKRLGIDVARFGDDKTVIFPRQGLMAYDPVELRNARTQEIAARIAKGKANWGAEAEFIDDTGGWGAGVIDALLQAGHAPHAVNFAGRADDARYFNKRSEMWFRMADWVRRGGALPEDSELARELSTPTYSFQGGKFRLEEKDQIKERLGFSPDRADALALTFAIEELPSAAEAPFQKKGGGLLYEFDPFDSERA